LLGTAAELRPGRDQDFVGQPMRVQIVIEGSNRLVEVAHQVVVPVELGLVCVEAAQGDVQQFDATTARDQGSSQLESRTKLSLRWINELDAVRVLDAGLRLESGSDTDDRLLHCGDGSVEEGAVYAWRPLPQGSRSCLRLGAALESERSGVVDHRDGGVKIPQRTRHVGGAASATRERVALRIVVLRYRLAEPA